MRCNFSELCSWEKRAEKKTCASTSVSSSAAQVFDHLYLLTSIFPVFPYQVFCLPFKEYTTSRSDHGLRSSVVKTFVFLIHFQSVKCILNVEQLFFHTLNSTIVLIAFLNALENCFLAGLSDLRGCIFFFPSFCVYSQMHIQSQYAFTLMALILILCPLAPSLQLRARDITSENTESKSNPRDIRFVLSIGFR